jgi:hypothetical protein
MLVFAKVNNHVVNHQTHDANHSVLELVFNMFAFFKTVPLMVLMLNKFNQAHVKVLMDHNH